MCPVLWPSLFHSAQNNSKSIQTSKTEILFLFTHSYNGDQVTWKESEYQYMYHGYGHEHFEAAL